MTENSEKKNQRKDPGLRWVIPFFLVLGLLTAASFCLPLRPARSQMEKRDLTPFPEFTWEDLVSGSYFDGITTWFSDTFPGREGWIRLSSGLPSLYGKSDIILSQEAPQLQQEPVETQPPETEHAKTDKTGETEPTEEISEATEAAEAGWGGVDAAHAKEIYLGPVIQIDDAAFNIVGYSEIYSRQYARTLTEFAKKVEPMGVRVVSAPCPTSISIMVEKEFLEALRCADQEATIQGMHSQMEGVTTVDTFNALVDHNDEYIYFRTDHHWTALGAYYSYRAICEALGYEPAELDSFEIWDQEEFEGSLTYKCERPAKLRRDRVYAYKPQGDITFRVYNGSRPTDTSTERPLLQDMRQRNLNTKYLTFIWSDNPLSVIINDSLPDAPNCLVVKDSYGNCLAPFLSQNYHKVYIVDYRKYSGATLEHLAEQENIRDVLFVPYVTATQSVSGNNMIMTRCGVKP